MKEYSDFDPSETPEQEKLTKQILDKIERPRGWRPSEGQENNLEDNTPEEFAETHRAVTPKGSFVQGTPHLFDGTEETKNYFEKHLVPQVLDYVRKAVCMGKKVTFLAESDPRWTDEQLKGGSYGAGAEDDEQFQMARKLKDEFGDKVEVKFWDEYDGKPGSKVDREKVRKETGISDLLVRTGLVIDKMGQGEDLEGLRKDGDLTPEIEDYIEKEHGVSLQEKKILSEEDRLKLYYIAFPKDVGESHSEPSPDTPYSAITTYFNYVRDRNLLEKIKRIEDAGGIAVITPGASHAWELKGAIELA